MLLFPFTFPIPSCAGQEKSDKTPPKKQDNPRYEFREEHDPNGTGKFYMGREIALVMGWQGASWLERPKREKQEQPKKLYEVLKIKPGDAVADIGAGSGYHTFRIAEIVGDKGKVYAVDIQKEMLQIIRRRMKKGNIDNVVPVKGTVKSAKLPPKSVDLILMVDVYHEFYYPYEMTADLIKALKPKGRLVFVEFRKEDPKVPIKLVHKMYKKQVLKEMTPFKQMRYVRTYDVLPWQHIIVFEKK